MTCFCRACVPTTAAVVCSACGEEIRIGVRDGQRAWWHRAAVDHAPILGHRAAQAVPRKVQEAADAAQALEDGEEPEADMEPVEIPARPVDPTEFAATSGLRQIANIVSGVAKVSPTTGKPSKAKNAVPAAPGWELVSLTHSRGPYMGAKGGSLGVSDCHVLKARGPVGVDGSRPVAVASWRDLKFDFAYIGTLKGGRLTTERVSSDAMKDWIKAHDGHPLLDREP